MVAIIGSFVVVWLVLFAGWGYLHEIIPPGTMTQDEYAIQYMIVGAVICLIGAGFAYHWFERDSNLPSSEKRMKVKRDHMWPLILPVGVAGAGYLFYLGAGDAMINSIFALIGGFLVFVVADLIHK